MSATIEQIAATFTEWDRRYREEPERFFSESARLGVSSTSYGEACAPYFLEILQGIKAQQASAPADGAGLTPAEKEILRDLAAAWDGFVKLEPYHPDDIPTIRQAINDAQACIAFRVAVRADPDFWVAVPSSENTQ